MDKLYDINNKELYVGNIIIDNERRKYEITKHKNELFAKSLFNDAGCGEYFLCQNRIIENQFKIMN